VQRVVLDAAVASLYPGREWGRPDDEARFRAGVPRSEVRRLARSLSALAKAPTYFRAGAEEDLCDFVWVLCVGRAPALLEVREGRAEVESPHIEEKYLRVCFSTVARLAAVQEVTLTLDADEHGAPGSPGVMIREAPRPGVFDPLLLKRMQKIVALCEASDVAHIDFGLLDVPLDGARPGVYVERYGVEPRLLNFLFYAQPSTTASVTALAR
jgi:hypothetical protein